MKLDGMQLAGAGLEKDVADVLATSVRRMLAAHAPSIAWQMLTREHLTPEHPFAVHRMVHDAVFADWHGDAGPPPAWIPSETQTREANITAVMEQVDCASYAQFHAWTTQHPDAFWRIVLERLSISMTRPPEVIRGDVNNPRHPRWLHGARYNITSSCFQGSDERVALVQYGETGDPREFSLGELAQRVAQVAHGLQFLGIAPGDAVAICMPMTVEAVSLYLGIIAAGAVVVSIADSFASSEIARRMDIAGASVIFTQDHVTRGGKRLPLYQRVVDAKAPKAVVIHSPGGPVTPMREDDLDWESFLADEISFCPIDCNPSDTTNILFSSGTTGDPKAIPWTHLTPIRAASDAHFHHDIHPGDVLAWPTNLGWMMGPWLIYAALVNQATIGLYDGAPTTAGFGNFVQNARVTMLGVVPSLVRAWRESDCLAGCDWSRIKAFSSTGECSNADDMLYLMSRARYKPIIEYCGGTEIGGGYITGTVIQPASPATFTTPALGTAITILDDTGAPADDGELFIVPPALGLSETLLNREHDTVYFDDSPPGADGASLRRHGDQITRLAGGFYRAQGRMDDTMNLGGIKVSAAEIERVVARVGGVHEAAAIAIPEPGGGPSQLIIYTVHLAENDSSRDRLRSEMQRAIRTDLSPLFRISDVVPIDALPRTASNKIMRRELRRRYMETRTS